MISLMEPIVLAGPVEFSTADVIAILAVLAAVFVIVTAPGWLTLAIVLGRRSAGPTRRRVVAGVGGALLGVAVSAMVAAAFLALGGASELGSVGAVLAAWASCWGLALMIRRRPAPTAASAPAGSPAAPAPSVPGAPGPSASGARPRPEEGWGR